MDGFLLSPGITPTLTDIFVAELPIAVGVGWVLDRRRGVLLALALNAFTLGAIKLVTDYPDLFDDVVALGGLAAGFGLSLAGLAPSRLTFRWRPGVVALSGLLVIVGTLKLLGDFFDPFDVLLADLLVVGGIIGLVGPRDRVNRASAA